MNVDSVNSVESALRSKPHDHPVLQFMAQAGMEPGDSISCDAALHYGIGIGLTLEDMEKALREANAKGWIIPSDRHIDLTAVGYLLLYPANDNPLARR